MTSCYAEEVANPCAAEVVAAAAAAAAAFLDQVFCAGNRFPPWPRKLMTLSPTVSFAVATSSARRSLALGTLKGNYLFLSIQKQRSELKCEQPQPTKPTRNSGFFRAGI